MPELVVRTADGVTLAIDRVVPAGVRRGVVVCLHAMMTDGRYFGARRTGEASFTAALAADGIEVFVADFRGHGRSVPPHAGPGDWSFDDLVELDLPAITGAVCDAAEIRTDELAILGHSLGGLVAAAGLGTGRIPAPKALVLAATSVWLPGPDGPIARRTLMSVYRGVTRVLGRAPIRALRVGTSDESRTYVAQLTGWSRSGRWTSLRGVDYLAALANITVRTCSVVGTGDWMCRPADAEQISGRIPSAGPLRIVGRDHGDFLDPDHFELFTRPELGTWRQELVGYVT